MSYLLTEEIFSCLWRNCGTNSFCPPLPGLDKVKHAEAADLLMNPSLMGNAKNIVVVGGVVGCETACWLSYEYGKSVKVAEMLKNFMEGDCTANRDHLIHCMEKNGAELFNCARVESFQPGRVLEANRAAYQPACRI